MVKQALDEKNFSNDALMPLCTFGISCPLCRTYLVQNPFKLLPPEVYNFYDSQQKSKSCCQLCAFESQSTHSMVKHVLFECETNKFSCAQCSESVNWGNFEPDALVRSHILSNVCTGMRCNYMNRNGTVCNFVDRYEDAIFHYYAHSVRETLMRKIKKVVNALDFVHLPNLLQFDFKGLGKRTPTAEDAEKFLEMVYRTQMLAEGMTQHCDDEETDGDNDDDDDDEDNEEEDAHTETTSSVHDPVIVYYAPHGAHV